MKRTTYKDGWHDVSENFRFYVENGELKRGVRNDTQTVYPYKHCKSGGYDNVSGIEAKYGILKKIAWF